MGQGQVHTGVQTSNANPAAQTVRPRTTNPMTSPPNPAQLAPGSPPVSHSGGSRTHGAPLATGQAESTSVQPGVPVRQACSQMVPHQVVRHSSHPSDVFFNLSAPPAKSKRVPQIGGAMLATRQPVDKPRRHSESDNLVCGRVGSSSRAASSSTTTTASNLVAKSGLHAQLSPSPLHGTFLFSSSKHAAAASQAAGDSMHGPGQVGTNVGCRTPPPSLDDSPPLVRGHRRRSGSMPSHFTLAHKADKVECLLVTWHGYSTKGENCFYLKQKCCKL